MPGHVKTGGPKEADPDPSEFLIVSFEMKKEDSLKPYDAKKSVWVPDGEGGYDEALIDTVDGDKVTVKVGWEPKVRNMKMIIMEKEEIIEKFYYSRPSSLPRSCRSTLPRWRSSTMCPTW